jgi:hypothetical protein
MVIHSSIARYVWPLLLVVVPVWQVVPVYARGLAIALLLALVSGVVLFAWQARRRALHARTPRDRALSLLTSVGPVVSLELSGALFASSSTLHCSSLARIQVQTLLNRASRPPSLPVPLPGAVHR